MDINEKNLVLKATKKYYLDITLPYKVDNGEGKAKFDAKTKTLSVTLPVVYDKDDQEIKKPDAVEEIGGNGDEDVEEGESEENEQEQENKNGILNIVNEESQKKYKEGIG